MSAHTPNPNPRFTMPDLLRCKREGRKITSVTAYDTTFARLADQAGIDLLMVGDSLGMVVQGHPNTLPVTLEEMIYHTRAVMRGTTSAAVVTDLPFGSYQNHLDQALAAAIRIVKEGGSHGVKLEWFQNAPATVAAITAIGIPVIGHVGLTPQSFLAFGGFKIQGRGEAGSIVAAQAQAMAEAGAMAVVLEGIPTPLAQTITAQLPVPTIGIGAGPSCDGQVLVNYDLLGLFSGWPQCPERTPRFVKRYLDGGTLAIAAFSAFAREVQEGRFPAPEHGFTE